MQNWLEIKRISSAYFAFFARGNELLDESAGIGEMRLKLTYSILRYIIEQQIIKILDTKLA